LCPSLRIRRQLPAHSVNGGVDSFWKRPDFQLWRARDLDLGSSHTVILHTVVHHSSTSTYASNFIEIEETFCVRMDGRLGRTYTRTDRLALLGGLRRVDLEMGWLGVLRVPIRGRRG